MTQKISFLFFALFALSTTLSAQTTKKYTHRLIQSQARMMEPQQGMVSIPMIADLELTSVQRIEFIYNMNIEYYPELTDHILSEIKKTALAAACKEYDADVMLAVLFQMDTINEGTEARVIVNGYPAKYKNIRQATKEELWIKESVPDESSKYTPKQILNT